VVLSLTNLRFLQRDIEQFRGEKQIFPNSESFRISGVTKSRSLLLHVLNRSLKYLCPMLTI
jgi:hypothetical protein